MLPQKRAKLAGVPPTLTVQNSDGEWKMIVDKQDCRLLGATMRNNLSWQSHLVTAKKAVLPAARKILGALSTLKSKMPRKSRLQLTNSLVVSKLLYLLPLWGGATANYLAKAQVLMNSAARFATGLPKRTRIKDLFKECGWLTLHKLNYFHSCLHLWKIIRMGKPMHMKRQFLVDNQNKISTAQPRLQFSEDCYRWRTIRYWNDLPDTIRGNLVLPKFKKQLKKWILERRLIEPD